MTLRLSSRQFILLVSLHNAKPSFVKPRHIIVVMTTMPTLDGIPHAHSVVCLAHQNRDPKTASKRDIDFFLSSEFLFPNDHPAVLTSQRRPYHLPNNESNDNGHSLVIDCTGDLIRAKSDRPLALLFCSLLSSPRLPVLLPCHEPVIQPFRLSLDLSP